MQVQNQQSQPSTNPTPDLQFENPFDNLPNEVALMIFSKFSTPTLAQVKLVSKNFNACAVAAEISKPERVAIENLEIVFSHLHFFKEANFYGHERSTEIDLYFDKMGRVMTAVCQKVDLEIRALPSRPAHIKPRPPRKQFRYIIQKNKKGAFQEIKASEESVKYQISVAELKKVTLIWNSSMNNYITDIELSDTELDEFPQQVRNKMVVLGNQMYRGALKIVIEKFAGAKISDFEYQYELTNLFKNKEYSTGSLLIEGKKAICWDLLNISNGPHWSDVFIPLKRI